MRVTFEIDDDVSDRLEELAAVDLPEARREMVDEAIRAALRDTVEFNPVDTGRSRSAWVAALAQLGGAPPAGWRGPKPQAGAIAEGASLGAAEAYDETDRSERAASNAVRYVPFLEYGTSRMSPFAMARRALRGVRQRAGMWFRFPRG